MRRVSTFYCFLPLALFALAASPAAGNEDEVRAVGEAYVEAFEKGDAQALAEFWSSEAVYTNRLTGEQVIGREAIAEQFEAILGEAKKIELQVAIDSIEFVSPNVAVENGVATYSMDGSEPESIPYSAVYIRHGGKWLLDRVTDKPEPEIKSNYEQLQVLEWIIGTWVDEDEDITIVTECKWTKNQNFITRSFTVANGDDIQLSGMQVIGWDPKAEQIRSWTFDSDGGFSEGTWQQEDNFWFIKKRGTLPDGSTASATSIIEMVDNDTFEFQSVHRTVAGQMLPNVNEVRVVRQQ